MIAKHIEICNEIIKKQTVKLLCFVALNVSSCSGIDHSNEICYNLFFTFIAVECNQRKGAKEKNWLRKRDSFCKQSVSLCPIKLDPENKKKS